MVMNREEDIKKMKYHLYNSGSYKMLEKNPISKITRLVKKAIKETNLDDKLKKCLTPNSEISPRIYGAPKIIKINVPFGAPTYELVKYVTSTLSPIVVKTNSFIKDSSQYVEFIK